MEHQSAINSVPDEILLEIFVYMTGSLKTIMITLPSVCKRFYKLIDPPKVVNNHPHHLDSSITDQLNNLNIADDDENGDDLMNDRLYEQLIRMYSFTRFDESEILKRYHTFRSAFLKTALLGLSVPVERCFRRELCYKGISVLESEHVYQELKKSGDFTSDSIVNVKSCDMGRTVLMKEDYQSSNAGISIVNNPMIYDTGVYFFEFLVHKTGTYDNCLMGIILADNLPESHVEDPSSFNLLSERFDLKTKSLDVNFLDYIGSSQSVGFGYYDEGFHVYHKNTSITSYDFNNKQDTISYPCDMKDYSHIIGVYFDSKNLHLAFSRNGIFTRRQLDISDLIHNKHVEYLSGNLAFYPALSMGQLADAISFETRVPFEKIQSLKKISKTLVFEPYSSD